MAVYRLPCGKKLRKRCAIASPAVTAATVTLELGIDIGQLERVIQLEAPLSVASFLQRLGRSGRRGAAADMQFVCAEDELSGEESLPEQIPWQLLQAIAIIQLYLEERWIEPIKPLQLPFEPTISPDHEHLNSKGRTFTCCSCSRGFNVTNSFKSYIQRRFSAAVTLSN
jgi:hypothetical protein